MTNINWLHLSDLHRGMTSQQWLWANVESMFFDDLAKLHDRCGPWHIIFFTGDLAQKGTAAEYRKLNDTLTRLYQHLERLGSKPILVAIPGNHDLKRPKPDAPMVKLLRNWANDAELQDQFWSNSNSPYRKQIKKAFAAYEEWVDSHPFPKPTVRTKGLLPGDFAASIEQEGFKVGVIGLNVAFLQLTGGPYENQLALDARQLTEICGEHYDDWFRAHDCNFLLTHHPPSWLNNDSRSTLESEIHIPRRFLAHLSGHMHEHQIYAESKGGAKPRHHWQAPSIFGLEQIANTQKRMHGYALGKLTVENNGAQLRVWPRTCVPHNAGHLHIIPDPSSTLDDDGGLSISPVHYNQRHSITPTTRRPSFSVLLLATEQDLKDARQAIALHLRKSLGVLVTETDGEESIDPSTFDHLILIQGWWWNGGKAAKLWGKVAPSKRTTLLIHENSNWPPLRLAELSATTDINAFRSRVENAIYFEDPKELPEKVGESVTKLVQNTTGDERLGLRDWERAYMDFRLPAWRSGRTASPGHLLEAENTEELYQADLYVTLEGISRKWQKGPDGRPMQIPKKKKKNSSEIAQEYVEQRVPLGRWLSVPQLNRIALVGAPGGGKTIFLTRTAAAVASACLGRPGDLEPDIDVECLRHQSGTLPIPVVLEATRIANRADLNVAALIDAMSDEMAILGRSRPRTIELKQGLRNGRYLLLIDALDEIADSSRRTAVLDLLKGLAAPAVLPRTRVILTTRSARYTGSLKFGPELEIVEVAPLSGKQVSQLCRNWTTHRGRDQNYFDSLMNAVSGLVDQVGTAAEDQSLTENPLMLTAICMVFERYRTLPDDRGRLCELLIDDLCRSRNSEDVERGWKLDDATKKDLLQRIALAMQEEGAQTWPVSRAIEIAITLVPTGDKFTQLRAKKYLDWAADHTGLLRFQQDPKGEEHIRFWHRLFREYLAAARLAQLDKTASDMIDQLWRDKRLENPFWEDVVRLLPRPLGTKEKAGSLRQRLEHLANENPLSKARLLGLAAAGIIENRDLFPDVDFPTKAAEMGRIYENEGENWPFKDKLLFLEGLGRLDPVGGDPRFHTINWIEVSGGEVRLSTHDYVRPGQAVELREEVVGVKPFHIASSPVTVQEYYEFIESMHVEDMDHSLLQGRRLSNFGLTGGLKERIRRQLRHPNSPVVMISSLEAKAFCKWRSKKFGDDLLVRLPLESEVMYLRSIMGPETFPPYDKDLKIKRRLARHPVGSFQGPKSRVLDLWGTLWQWCVFSHRSQTQALKRLEARVALVFGARQDSLFEYPPRREFTDDTIGFRCVLARKENRIQTGPRPRSRRV